MLDVNPLILAVDRFADRLRAAPESRLRRGAAAEALALARELALLAQRVEAPEREPLVMPDAGVFAVADQVMVAGRDLAQALHHAKTPPGGEPGGAVKRVEAAEERAFG